MILLFVAAELLNEVFHVAKPLGEVITYMSYGFFIVISCFFVRRLNPSSLWYAPVICNTLA